MLRTLGCGVAASALLAASAVGAAPLEIPTDSLGGVRGQEPSGLFGRRVAVGDFDGDGVPDLAVVSGIPHGVWIFHGLFAADSFWPGPALTDRVPSTERDTFVALPELPAHLGFQIRIAEIAVGNVLGDGADAFDDLIVSSPNESPTELEIGAGVVRIYAGPLSDGLLEGDDADVVIAGDLTGRRLGTELGVGDLDGDGLDDLAIGQSQWDTPETNDGRGRVWVFYGAPTAAWDATLEVADVDVLFVGEGLDEVGSALDFASIDADGRDDLIIQQGDDLIVLSDPAVCAGPEGVRPSEIGSCELGSFADRTGPVVAVPPGHPNAGVWIGAPGTESDDTGALLWYSPDTDWDDPAETDAAHVVIVGTANLDLRLGSSVVRGDLDRDGADEIVVASPGWDDDFADVVHPIGDEAGAVYVLDGCHTTGGDPGDDCGPSGSGVQAAEVATHRIHGNQGGQGYNQLAPDESLRVLVVSGRVLIFAPLYDDPAFGTDTGGLFVWQRFVDVDQDLHPAGPGLDCDDGDPTVHPDAEELCNGVDDDCDGVLPGEEVDDDGDGVSECEGDCDDADPLRSPNNLEVACDLRDSDCDPDGLLHPDETDDDGDGFSECAGDCDDGPDGAARTPGDPEDCNGIDDDCNGVVDDGFDLDGDGAPGQLGCIGVPIDCDDNDPTIHPGAVDGPGPEDMDCDGSSNWPGGCACDAGSGPARGSGLAALVLLIGVGRLRRRRRAGARLRFGWSLVAAVIAAPLLSGQVVVSTDDAPVIAVGQEGDLASVSLATMALPGRPEPALLIGAPKGDSGGVDAGVLYVIQPDGALDEILDSSIALCAGVEVNQIMGTSLGSGDFDGDGIADIAWGGPTDSLWASAEVAFASGATIPVEGLGCQQRTYNAVQVGLALDVSDLDDDGFDDVVVGEGLVNFSGSLKIFYGEPDFFGPEPAESPHITQTLFGTPGLGYFVEAGVDWNGDGRPEIATGRGGWFVVLINGDPLPWTEGGLVGSYPSFEVSGGGGLGGIGVVGTKVVQLPDVTGNGLKDVLIGTPSSRDYEGGVFLVEGTDPLPPAITLAEDAVFELSGGVELAAAGYSLLPVFWTVDPASTNRPDLLVGMPLSPAPGSDVPGGVVAFVASADIPWDGSPAGDDDDSASGEATNNLLSLASWMLVGTELEAFVGTSMELWTDRDGDGDADVAVGGAGHDAPDFGEDSGQIWLIESSQFRDGDGDGVLRYADCDDSDATVYGGAPELCDEVDNDCDGVDPSGEADADGDGQRPCEGDCDDARAAIYSGAPEICDGLDDDCDGALGDDELDGDADGVTACDGDCAPEDAWISPARAEEEACDGLDEDCDGDVDEGFDADQDGVTTCAGDCDDNASSVPGPDEIPDNGLDDDCDGLVDVTPPRGCSCNAADVPGSPPTGVALLVGLFAFARRRR